MAKKSVPYSAMITIRISARHGQDDAGGNGHGARRARLLRRLVQAAAAQVIARLGREDDADDARDNGGNRPAAAHGQHQKDDVHRQVILDFAGIGGNLHPRLRRAGVKRRAALRAALGRIRNVGATMGTEHSAPPCLYRSHFMKKG